MTLPQASPPIPNNAVEKRDLLHSRKRLHYLTKVAVDKACKLHVESGRLVHIVDTQSCGSSKGLVLSSSFSSFMKKSSPSLSRQWALPKGSTDRRSVATRIHALLIEWKADSSFEWRAKVASAVPVLEEAFYKGTKSKEEYTNPQLLESQLIRVLCHFEAGNGPFLLQGSTPLYSVRRHFPSTTSVARMPLFHGNMLGPGLFTDEEFCELASEQTCERTRLGYDTNSAVVPSDIEQVANLGLVMNHQNHGGHASTGFVKRVANMLAKKRRESSVCLMNELRKVNLGTERAEDLAEDSQGRVSASTDMSDEVRPDHLSSRMTLGGILQLDMCNESTTQGIVVVVDAEESSVARSRSDQEADRAEGYPSPSNVCTETSSAMINKFPVDFTNPHGTSESGISEEGLSSLLGSYSEDSNVSGTTIAAPECGATNEVLSNQKKGAHGGRRSVHSPFSSLSLSFMPIAFASSTSSSSLTPHLSTSASPSHLFSQLPSHLGPVLPSSSPSALHASSLSPLQQQQAQHRSQCLPQRLAPLSRASDVISIRHSQPQIAGEANDCNVQSEPPQAFHPAEGPATQVEIRQAATQAVSVQHAEAGRGAFSLSSSPLVSNAVSSKARERGLKLPLRRFLAEREDYKGSVTGYVDAACPWETWEEATEQLDGMCCVCMVGLKGAAFIPCGHTFCRRCSRELWRGRGTCPLCNRYIREILDIY
ncbi:hypothetical protein GOP47_0027052 [Adiantum capillus-veneris]|nr:hypothetical protein GOP47_0027052 [Adiantum capillus-veneris]